VLIAESHVPATKFFYHQPANIIPPDSTTDSDSDAPPATVHQLASAAARRRPRSGSSGAGRAPHQRPSEAARRVRRTRRTAVGSNYTPTQVPGSPRPVAARSRTDINSRIMIMKTTSEDGVVEFCIWRMLMLYRDLNRQELCATSIMSSSPFHVLFSRATSFNGRLSSNLFLLPTSLF
jgi:hypothetical protein